MSFCSLSPFFFFACFAFTHVLLSERLARLAFARLLSVALSPLAPRGRSALPCSSANPSALPRASWKKGDSGVSRASFVFLDVETMWLTKLLATVRSAASPSFRQRASARFSPVLGAVAE